MSATTASKPPAVTGRAKRTPPTHEWQSQWYKQQKTHCLTHRTCDEHMCLLEGQLATLREQLVAKDAELAAKDREINEQLQACNALVVYLCRRIPHPDHPDRPPPIQTEVRSHTTYSWDEDGEESPLSSDEEDD